MGRLNVGGNIVNMTLAVGPSNGSSPVQEVTFSGSVTIVFDLQGGTNLQFVTRASSPEAGFIDELATDVWLMGDVLQARPEEWIRVRAMPVVAPECAGAALRRVVLGFSEAIVDQQHDATHQHRRNRAHQRTGRDAYCAHVRSRQVEPGCCMQ